MARACSRMKYTSFQPLIPDYKRSRELNSECERARAQITVRAARLPDRVNSPSLIIVFPRIRCTYTPWNKRPRLPHGSLTNDPIARANYSATEWKRLSGGYLSMSRALPKRSRSTTPQTMSWLVFYLFWNLGLLAHFWRCRAILLYPEMTVYQVSRHTILTLAFSLSFPVPWKKNIAVRIGFAWNN